MVLHRLAMTMAVAACLGFVGCGSDTPEGTFDPSTAETFILNKARADVSSNPALLVEEPGDPIVSCEQAAPGETSEEETARFTCDVEIEGEGGAPLGRQRWIAEVELDSVTGDTVVRSSRRVMSTITPAPSPLRAAGQAGQDGERRSGQDGERRSGTGGGGDGPSGNSR